MINAIGLLKHLCFNLIFVWGIIHFLYYKKSHRQDYYFTFLLISVSIFMIIFLLSSIKMKVGFALGLFAVFGILRYRTISLPVREMSYLFVLITLSVINALGIRLGWNVLAVANISFVIIIIIADLILNYKRKGIKYIKYDRIDLCKYSKRTELIADIEERFELKVVKYQIGAIDCLKDMALIKVWYEPTDEDMIDEEIVKLPKE
ncbi:MAG: DUF4956 domain-containing protein [Bacteroidaceae bacterium]|nr:DUF4956 domain-containing protein [Bacteroidaceae bacterium]